MMTLHDLSAAERFALVSSTLDSALTEFRRSAAPSTTSEHFVPDPDYVALTDALQRTLSLIEESEK